MNRSADGPEFGDQTDRLGHGLLRADRHGADQQAQRYETAERGHAHLCWAAESGRGGTKNFLFHMPVPNTDRPSIRIRHQEKKLEPQRPHVTVQSMGLSTVQQNLLRPVEQLHQPPGGLGGGGLPGGGGFAPGGGMP